MGIRSPGVDRGRDHPRHRHYAGIGWRHRARRRSRHVGAGAAVRVGSQLHDRAAGDARPLGRLQHGPVSPVEWILRRLDHSAIYLLIAGTYRPFIAEMKSGAMSAVMFAGVWLAAIAGMTLKLALPGRLDRLAVVFYLLLGWSGAFAYNAVAPTLPSFRRMAACSRRSALLNRHRVPRVAEPALSECDLARLRAARRVVPLLRGLRRCRRAQPRRAKPGAASAEFCGYLAVGRRRWRILLPHVRIVLRYHQN